MSEPALMQPGVRQTLPSLIDLSEGPPTLPEDRLRRLADSGKSVC